MTLPSDAELTKLRILRDRAQREQDAADAAALRARRKLEEADMAYARRGRELDVCVFCENTMGDCDCPAPQG